MDNQTVYIGIDPTAGKRDMTCAILDAHLKLLSLIDAPFDQIIETVLSYPSAVCGIDAPATPNSGRLTRPDYRKRVGLEPDRDNYAGYRVCEFELRSRGIYIYNTPFEDEKISSWMDEGWRLYDRLREAGFIDASRPGSRRLFETYPYAVFAVLAGTRPYSKLGLEGRLQRQLLLFDEGLDVPDPMLVLQEWTRYRLRRGELVLDDVYNHDQLDALAAAFTAWTLDREPDRTVFVGDLEEGQIILPTGQLQDSY